MTHARWIGLYVAGMVYLHIALSLLLTAFLGVCIGLRKSDRAVHPALKYASIAVLVAVVAVAGLATYELLDVGEALGGVFVALVLVPLAVMGAYFHYQSHLTPIDLLATIALSWGPSFILGLIIVGGVILGVGGELGLAQTNRQEAALGLLGLLLGGVTVVASSVRLGSWVNPLLSRDSME